MKRGLFTYVVRIARSPRIELWRAKIGDSVDQNMASSDSRAFADYAGSICDLAATSIMRIALGSARVNAMEATTDDVWSSGDDDVRRFTDATAFREFMNDWVTKEVPGVVQFKFKPQSGAHTFCAERIPPEYGVGSARFQIYQAYQGSYRLSDFLGITNCKPFVNSAALTTEKETWKKCLHVDRDGKRTYRDSRGRDIDWPQGLDWPDLTSGDPPALETENEGARKYFQKKWKQSQKNMEEAINQQVGDVSNSMRGFLYPLAKNDFLDRVVGVLQGMLTEGGASGGEYTKLTGHHAKNSLTCSKILVLAGDFTYTEMAVNAASTGESGQGWVSIG